jgi:uncharacterized DUF497 family protein
MILAANSAFASRSSGLGRRIRFRYFAHIPDWAFSVSFECPAAVSVTNPFYGVHRMQRPRLVYAGEGRDATNRPKAQSNLNKHHVSFGEAATVFNDALARILPDEDHSVEDEREIIVGHSSVTKARSVGIFHGSSRESDSHH